MTIKVGDRLPEAKFATLTDKGAVSLSTGEIFGRKTSVVFAVPGAFTPTCHKDHLPGFINRAQEIKSKGVDQIICIATNDVFVMDAWARELGANDKILMLTDDNGAFSKAIGLDIDLNGPGIGLGVRSKRYSMLVDNGMVTSLNVDDPPTAHVLASAATMCSILDANKK